MQRHPIILLLLLTFAFPTLVATPAKAWLTSTCRSFSLEVRTKKKPHKAMVSGHHLDEEYCGGAWGQPSKEAAIRLAMQACRKVGVHDCILVWAE
jgi:hypothetical protein